MRSCRFSKRIIRIPNAASILKSAATVSRNHLSAQCTDDRVNIVTKDLFKKYKSAKDFADVPQEVLEKDIQSTGFFRNRQEHSCDGEIARRTAQRNRTGYDGRTFRTRRCGQKNCECCPGKCLPQKHRHRGRYACHSLSQRLGLTKNTDAVKIEHDLIPLVPQDDWTLWSHLMIYNGRKICQARKPKCLVCPILQQCPSGTKFIQSGEARD